MVQEQHEDMAPCGWRRGRRKNSSPPAMLSPGRLLGSQGEGGGGGGGRGGRGAGPWSEAADLTPFFPSPESKASHNHHCQGAGGLQLEGDHCLPHGQSCHRNRRGAGPLGGQGGQCHPLPLPTARHPTCLWPHPPITSPTINWCSLAANSKHWAGCIPIACSNA